MDPERVDQWANILPIINQIISKLLSAKIKRSTSMVSRVWHQVRRSPAWDYGILGDEEPLWTASGGLLYAFNRFSERVGFQSKPCKSVLSYKMYPGRQYLNKREILRHKMYKNASSKSKLLSFGSIKCWMMVTALSNQQAFCHKPVQKYA